MTEAPFGSSGVIGVKYLKNNALFTGFACVASAIFFYFTPRFPFDARLAPILASASLMYFLFFLCFDRCRKNLQAYVIALSLVGLCVVTSVVHVTGGIASPLVCFYFALLVSEVGYGVTSTVTIYAAVASYLGVVLGEAFGYLEVNNPLTKAIYENRVVFVFIALSITTYMIITGHVYRLIFRKLKNDFAMEQSQKQALLKRFSELDAHSHIGMMAHRMVHDLRNPLAAISGYVELESMAPGKDEVRQAALRDLSETVAQMSGALNNIARFGRAGGEAKETIAMKEFFHNLTAIASFSKDAARVKFRRSYPESPDFFVLAVRHDLQQAYFNILKNALEAVRENTGERVIDIAMRPSAGTLEVEIGNNGKSIPEDILKQIFVRAVTGKSDGTGVGMLITHDLLAKNDVGIEILNAAPAGVRVLTRLPLHQGGKTA